MLDLVGRRRWYFLISALIIIPGIISLAIPPRLKVGLEFTSGTSQTISFLQSVTQEDLRAEMATQGQSDAIIQGSPKDAYLITTAPLAEADRQLLEEKLGDALGLQRVVTFERPENPEQQIQGFIFSNIEEVTPEKLIQKLTDLGYSSEAAPERAGLDTYLIRTRVLEKTEAESLRAALETRFGPLASYNFFEVSPLVAAERARNASFAVVAASAAILLYITWAFRRMTRPFLYGTFAVVALIHDTLVVLGIFSILGKVLGTEIDSMFITGILTVIGYSVHDTIVVFDRIRENTARGMARDLETTINISLNETMSRSLNTSLTIFFTLFALALIGGVTLRNFMLVLIIGIIVGTYSSICIASQLLVVWERGELKKLTRWLPLRQRGPQQPS
ncbi:MAG: protein translocase subunit SecF [Chloroflexi bacterium]|nr:protein translocase subunit SecF [Chloroflexota bacterium]